MVRFKVCSHLYRLLHHVLTRPGYCDTEPLAPGRASPGARPPARTHARRPAPTRALEQANLGRAEAEHHHALRRHRVGRGGIFPDEYVPYRPPRIRSRQSLITAPTPRISQVLLAADEPLHHTRRAGATQDRMGGCGPDDCRRRAQVCPACRARLRYVSLSGLRRAGARLRGFAGTIKQAQLAAIRHNREIVARYRARAKLPGASVTVRCVHRRPT